MDIISEQPFSEATDNYKCCIRSPLPALKDNAVH